MNKNGIRPDIRIRILHIYLSEKLFDKIASSKQNLQFVSYVTDYSLIIILNMKINRR